MTPQELVDEACPRVRDIGWAFYFAPVTRARADELGVDQLTFYFLGRGGVLGDVDADVVSSAFGYFNPELVRGHWEAGRARVSPPVAGHAFFDCAAEYGRTTFAGVDGIDQFCAAADAVNDAADPIGLALYAAARCEALAEDPPARAMQLLALLREYRGSAHLLAVRASGLDALTAHCVKRPGALARFGWGIDDAVDVSDADRAAWDRAEALTDELVLPAYSVLDTDARTAFVVGLDRVEAALAA